jgi:hypothetical protein
MFALSGHPVSDTLPPTGDAPSADAVGEHAMRLSTTHCAKPQEKPSWDQELHAGQRDLNWMQTGCPLRTVRH